MRIASLPFLLFAAWIFYVGAGLLSDGHSFGAATFLALFASASAFLGVKLFRRTAIWWAPFISALVVVGGCILLLAIFLQPGSPPDVFEVEIWVTSLIALAFAAAAIRLLFAWGARERKAMLWTTLVMLAIPVAGLIWFDTAWLQPRLQAVRAQVEDPSLGSDLRLSALIEADMGGGLQGQVVRMLSAQQSGSTMQRHFAELFALWLLPLHCDRAEQRTLFATFAYVGKEQHGLPAGARIRFGREISQLDDSQLATLVALTRGPGYMDKHPDKLAARARKLQESLPGAP